VRGDLRTHGAGTQDSRRTKVRRHGALTP
jgi:hypothetical protein